MRKYNNEPTSTNNILKIAIIILSAAIIITVIILAVMMINSSSNNETDAIIERNIIEEPVPTAPKQPKTEAPQKEEIVYRVRKSADDAASQIGAFVELENATKLADERKYEGFEVYDTNGNLIYRPAVEQNSSQQVKKIYRVRTSANDAASQIGAFEVLDNAKRLADERKSEGFKVFDENGNLIYQP